jgi:SAM-dependent methyltransferase
MSEIRELYRVEGLPVFQNRMFANAQTAIDCARGNVVLVQDGNTGLIYNRDFDPDLLDYGADYQNEQGISVAFKEHLRNVSSIIGRHLEGRSLIEVGCGKGAFLEQLQRDGYEITGLDPAYEGSNRAIRKEYFSSSTGIKADGIILRHVLEHVADPVSFLALLRDANGGQGKIYVEVPCLDWIMSHRAWFDIFYEHVNYFRLSDFQRMFGKVFEAGRTFGGQYLSIVADLSSLRKPSADSTPPFAFPPNFGDSIGEYAAFLGRKSQSDNVGQSVAVWGGASKGVIFTLQMQRSGIPIEIVVDVNIAKQGKFLPATGARVHSPQEAMEKLAHGADVFVMNSNYLAEIRDMTENRYQYIPVDDAANQGSGL